MITSLFYLLTLMQTYLPMYDISRTLFGPSLSIFQSVVTHYPYTYIHIHTYYILEAILMFVNCLNHSTNSIV